MEVLILARKSSLGKAGRRGGKKKPEPATLSLRETSWREKAGAGLLRLVLLLTVLLALAAPYREGIFRTPDFLVLHGYCFALFTLWSLARLLRRESDLIGKPVLYCLLALAFFYLLALFGAVDRRAGLGELLKVLNYLAVFIVAADLGRRYGLCAGLGDYPVRRAAGFEREGTPAGVSGATILLHALLAAALVMTIVSLGTAAGAWEIARVYVNGRLWTTIGYANAAAAYLSAAAFLAVALALGSGRPSRRALYHAAAALFLATTVLTLSRGTWLMLPFLALVMILAASGEQRGRLIPSLLLVAIVGAGGGFLFDRALRAETAGVFWGLLVLVPVLAGALTFPIDTLPKMERRPRSILLVAGVVLVFGAAILGGGAVVRRLGAPLQLSGSDAKVKPHLEQVLDRAVGGITYTLSLEVDARPETPANGEGMEQKAEPEQAWRLLVRSGGADYALTNILDHRGSLTAGWQEQEFVFTAPADSRRLELRLYAGEAGTTVTVQNVFLRGADSEARLRFIWHRLLPETFYRRIFSFGDRVAAVLRLDHYRIAGKMIRDYPVFGAGGGGWKALYLTYQDRPYWTSEVHSHYLQLWVEAGFLALLSFLGVWFFTLRDFFRRNHSRSATGEPAAVRAYRLAAFIPALTIAVHSGIDYDLSLGAMNIFLFILLGVGASLGAPGEEDGRIPKKRARGQKQAGPSTQSRWFGLAGLFLGLGLTIFSQSLLSSYNLRGEAAQRAAENKIPETLVLLRQAARRDPWQGESYFMLGMVYHQVADQVAAEDPEAAAELLLEGLDLARRAQKLAPYDAAYNFHYGQLLLQCGDEAEGLAYIDRLVELNPLVKDHYGRLAEVRLELADYYQKLGDEQKAAGYLAQILPLEEKMAAFHGKAAGLDYYLGRALYLLEEPVRSRSYLERVPKEDPHYREAQETIAQIAAQEAE